jgi:hypothetical protein
MGSPLGDSKSDRFNSTSKTFLPEPIHPHRLTQRERCGIPAHPQPLPIWEGRKKKLGIFFSVSLKNIPKTSAFLPLSSGKEAGEKANR